MIVVALSELHHPKGHDPFDAAFDAADRKSKAAKAEWETARKAFEQLAGNGAFLKTRHDAEALIRQAQEFPGEEARKIARLEARRRELQLRRHLERFKVAQAMVSGVGVGRRLTLRSFGIETAADVEFYRIVAIKGFGPSTANNLVNWRRAAEAKFAFDPNLAADPQDVAAVKAEIAKSRSDLASRLTQTAGMLQKAAQDAKASRTALDPRLTSAWAAFRQAEIDLQALRLT